MIMLTLKKENVITRILFNEEPHSWTNHKVKDFIMEFPEYDYEIDFRNIYDHFYEDDLPLNETIRANRLRSIIGV